MVACASPTQTQSSRGTVSDRDQGFNNILVIGKAQDYDARARFERTLVSQLKATGADATAYYVAVGGNKPIDQATITGLVETEKFDAVLITKVLSRNADAASAAGSTAGRSVRRDGGAVQLFLYDYEELNEPMTLSINVSAQLSSELFDTSNGELIWAIETQVSKQEMMSKMVDEIVSTVMRGLKKDRLINK